MPFWLIWDGATTAYMVVSLVFMRKIYVHLVDEEDYEPRGGKAMTDSAIAGTLWPLVLLGIVFLYTLFRKTPGEKKRGK